MEDRKNILTQQFVLYQSFHHYADSVQPLFFITFTFIHSSGSIVMWGQV